MQVHKSVALERKKIHIHAALSAQLISNIRTEVIALPTYDPTHKKTAKCFLQ